MNTADLCSTVLETEYIERNRKREGSGYDFTVAQVTEQTMLCCTRLYIHIGYLYTLTQISIPLYNWTQLVMKYQTSS